MKRVDSTIVDNFAQPDQIAAILPTAPKLTIDRWLKDSNAKRYLAQAIYGDLLHGPHGRSVVDIGGGVSSLTPLLVQNGQYVLVDVLAHDGIEEARAIEAKYDRKIVVQDDWYIALNERLACDVIIANDLFPNVDQRLESFITRAIPLASEIRLSLTFYNSTRFYLCKRIDAEEILCMLAWSGEQVAAVLKKFIDRIDDKGLSLLEGDGGSPFANGRHVVLLTLAGDRR